MGARTQMRLRISVEPQFRATEIGDDPVDQFEDRRRREEAAIEREIEKFTPAFLRLAAEADARGAERRRIGALETEDRLLEIADGEDRAIDPAARALACEIFG